MCLSLPYPPYLRQVRCYIFNLALFSLSFYLASLTPLLSVLLPPLIALLSSPMGRGPNQKEERSKPPIALRGHQDQRVDIEADSVSHTHWINPITHLHRNTGPTDGAGDDKEENVFRCWISSFQCIC